MSNLSDLLRPRSLRNIAAPLLLAPIMLTGCGDDDGPAPTTDGGIAMDATMPPTDGGTPPSGNVNFLLEAEDTIREGLSAGECDECLQDNWNATFERYVVAIGDIDLHISDHSAHAEAEGMFAYDLVQAPPAGAQLWSLEGLTAGRWEVNYTTGHATEAERDETVPMDVFEQMRAGECTYFIEGRIEQADGRSCVPNTDMIPAGSMADADGCFPNNAINFTFCVPAETTFGPCQSEDGPPGIAITESGASASLSIHGDHIFFNGFPEGDEGGIMRLAQWLADCDLNLDGEVTQAELEAIAIDDLAQIDARYDLGGAPPVREEDGTEQPLDDMWTYLRAQLKTQGHFNGEGECPADGVAHEH